MTPMGFARSGALGLLTLGLSGALLAADGAPATGSHSPAAPHAIAPHSALAVSLLDVMRASVQIPADGIWGAAGNDKLSDDEWLLAEQDSVNLVAAAALIA